MFTRACHLVVMSYRTVHITAINSFGLTVHWMTEVLGRTSSLQWQAGIIE